MKHVNPPKSVFTYKFLELNLKSHGGETANLIDIKVFHNGNRSVDLKKSQYNFLLTKIVIYCPLRIHIDLTH